VLLSAGWRVTTLDASTPIAFAWQRLPRAAEMLVATGATLHHGTGNGSLA
jgi:antirestriction protein ArdC